MEGNFRVSRKIEYVYIFVTAILLEFLFIYTTAYAK